MVLAGCGTSSGGAGNDASVDVASDASDTNDAKSTNDAGTLEGSQAFDVALTALNLGTPKVECGFSDTTADGGIAAAAIQIFAKDESAFTCGNGGPPSLGGYVEIAIATPEYAGGKFSNLTQSIAPGNYTIGEPSAVQPYCSFASNATAFVQVGTFDGSVTDYAWQSTSGTVTVTSATSTTIAGTFTTALTDTGGANIDGGTLSGSFTASTCP